MLTAAHLLLAVLAASLTCGTEQLFWHAAYVLINVAQVVAVLYLARENKFEADVEEVCSCWC